ncbi:hypothetical protein [Pseudomonas gorinensis]
MTTTSARMHSWADRDQMLSGTPLLGGLFWLFTSTKNVLHCMGSRQHAGDKLFIMLAYDKIVAYCKARQARGYKVVIAILPRPWRLRPGLESTIWLSTA